MAAKAPKKTECPVSLKEFLSSAKPLLVEVGGRQLVANPKEFSTGSFGWGTTEKIVVTVSGVPVKVQVGLNMTVVGSKG